MIIKPDVAYYLKLQRTELAGLEGEELAGKFQSQLNRDLDDLYWWGFLALTRVKRKTPLGNSFSVLDIGCGIGGIDLIIYKYVLENFNIKSNLHLIDKDGEKIQYGYKSEADTGFYNNLKTTRGFLTDNGIPDGNIFTYTPEQAVLLPKFDLIISLISCGFHYPVNSYIGKMVSGLSPDGVMILDIRRYSKQNLILDKFFESCTTIKDYEKHERKAYWK